MKMDPLQGTRFQEPPQVRPERAWAPAAQVIGDTLVSGATENLSLIPPAMTKAAAAATETMSAAGAEGTASATAMQVAGELAGTSAMQALDGKPQTSEFPRPMTEGEKREFTSYFPNLDVDKAVVSGSATPEYNCISWTVGETHNWFWPPSMYPDLNEEEAFDKFYGSYGFKPSPTGEVARWRNDQGLTHGCVSGPEHGPRWESKCGGALRIQHDLNELEGDIYGKVDAYYTKDKAFRPQAAFAPIEIPMEILSSVKERASNVPAQVRSSFDQLYSDWRQFRSDPTVRLSANPADYCKTDSFSKIVKLGFGAVPLLMDKMGEGDFFCLQAVDAIRRRPAPHGASLPSLSEEERRNSEQNKAALVLLKWFNA